VAAQRVQSDEIYRVFFAREAERGAEIIVDNGLSRCPSGGAGLWRER
jgi:hypothetical protein